MSSSSLSSLSPPSSPYQAPVSTGPQTARRELRVTICKIAHPGGCKTLGMCVFQDSQTKQIEEMLEKARLVGRICGRLSGHLPPSEEKDLLHARVSEMGNKLGELLKECLHSVQISQETGRYPDTKSLLSQRELSEEIRSKAMEAEHRATLFTDAFAADVPPAQPHNHGKDEKAFQQTEQAIKNFQVPEDSSLDSIKQKSLEQLQTRKQLTSLQDLFGDLLTCLQGIQAKAKEFGENISEIIDEQYPTPTDSIGADCSVRSVTTSFAKKQVIIALCSSLSLGATLGGVALLLLLTPVEITLTLVLSLTLIVLGSSALAMLVAVSLTARAKSSPTLESAKQSSFSYYYEDAPSGHGIE